MGFLSHNDGKIENKKRVNSIFLLDLVRSKESNKLKVINLVSADWPISPLVFLEKRSLIDTFATCCERGPS